MSWIHQNRKALFYWEFCRPAQRVAMVMERLSRNRMICGDEANRIICKMSNKISGNPASTRRAFCGDKHGFHPDHFRWWMGRECADNVEKWDSLEREARNDKCQFVLITKRQSALYQNVLRGLDGVRKTRKLINSIRKELSNGDHDK